MKKELELEMYLQNNIQSEINHSIEIIWGLPTLCNEIRKAFFVDFFPP